MAILQPVKQGLSAPVVTSIPNDWSAAWFRNFITNYLQNADIRNASVGGGLSVGTGGFTQPATITLASIPENTVLGSIEPGENPPQPLTATQLTALIRVFSVSTSGAVPAAPIQDPTLFLNATGTFTKLPVPPPVAIPPIPAIMWQLDDGDDQLIFPGPAGVPGVRGVDGVPGSPWVYPDDPDDPLTVPGPIGSAGPSGSQGLPGPAFVLTPEDPDDPLIIQGPAGAKGTAGTNGSAGQTLLLYPDDPDDFLLVPGPQGVQGTQGVPGASAAGVGWAAYLDGDPPEDIQIGLLNIPSVPAFAGAILGGVKSALPIVAPANGSQSLTASGLTFSFGSLLLTNTAEISSVGQVGIGSSTGAGGLILFTAASQRVTINPAGAVVVNAPSAGAALQVTGFAGSNALVVQGAATTGSAFGALLAGGSNASDYGLTVNNQANTLNYFSVRGDGNVITGGFGTNADSQFRVYSGGSTSKCDFRVGFNGTTSNFLDGGTFNIRDPGATFSIGAFSATGTGLTVSSAASQIGLQVNGHLSFPAAVFTNGAANDSFIEVTSASGGTIAYMQAASSIPDVRFGSLSNHIVSIAMNGFVLFSFNGPTAVGSSLATFPTVPNKPGSASAATLWLPILVAGTQYYVPLWR